MRRPQQRTIPNAQHTVSSAVRYLFGLFPSLAYLSFSLVPLDMAQLLDPAIYHYPQSFQGIGNPPATSLAVADVARVDMPNMFMLGAYRTRTSLFKISYALLDGLSTNQQPLGIEGVQPAASFPAPGMIPVPFSEANATGV